MSNQSAQGATGQKRERGNFAEWAVAILTIITCFVQIFQWKATRDAMIISSRSYVGVSDAILWATTPDPDGSGRYSLVKPDAA